MAMSERAVQLLRRLRLTESARPSDPEALLRRLWTALPQTPTSPSTTSPSCLRGVLVGVKDIIEVRGMPTGYGLDPGGQTARGALAAARDAEVVARLRGAGAELVAKLACTELACYGGANHARVANPWDPARTAGGSSSGSAAAVAHGLVDVAVGTQTMGSVVRPAAFCGVYSFKASHGALPLDGVLVQSSSADALGWFAGSVGLLARVQHAVTAPATEWAAPAQLPGGVLVAPRFSRRVWRVAEPETRACMAWAKERLRGCGVEVADVELPPSFEQLREAALPTILAREAHELLAPDWQSRASPSVQAWLDRGAAIGRQEYLDAVGAAESCRAWLHGELLGEGSGVAALLSPSAPGPAPLGLVGTGDPWVNALWTMCHLPAVHLPCRGGRVGGGGGRGLPVGVQLVGAKHSDRRLLGLASHIDAALTAQ